MCNIGSSVADIAVHLSHHTDMFITVEQGVLVVLDAVTSTVRSLVCLETGIR